MVLETQNPELETGAAAVKTCPLCGGNGPFGICRARHDGENLYCKYCIRKKVTNARRVAKERRTARLQAAAAARLLLIEAQGRLPLIGAVASPLPGVLDGKAVRDPRHPHVDRVLSAIHHGARTQKQIAKALGNLISLQGKSRHGWEDDWSQLDQVSDSLAVLMLDEPRRVRTETVDGVRHYLLVQQIRNPKSAIQNSAERAA